MSFLHSALSTRSHSSSPSTRPAAAQSMIVRVGVVHRSLLRTQTSLGPTTLRKGCALLNRPLALRGTVTWGVTGGLANPNRAAAVRWEATVPVGPARQAIMTFCDAYSKTYSRTRFDMLPQPVK